VVAPDATRRPATPDHPGRDPPDIGPRHRRGRMQGQALASIFVHQRQPLERATIRRPVVDEVAGPHVVLESGRSLDATVGTRPGFRAEFPGLPQPYGPLQPQLDPEPSHSLEIDRPAAA